MDSTDAVCGVRFTPGSRTIVGRSCPAPYDPYAVYGGSFSGLLAFEKLLADASNCGFKTLQQCMATVTGIGGSCEPNHFYNPGRSGRRGKAPARMMNT